MNSRSRTCLMSVRQLLLPEGRFSVIIPLNREAEFLIHEAARVSLYPKRRCVVRYVPHRPAKRVLLELDRSRGSVHDEELTVEATGPFDYSPGIPCLISDLMLDF